jgi:hypothetical protein
MPYTISFDEAKKIAPEIRKVLRDFPEVTTVTNELGRPDDGTSPTGFYNCEFYVGLKPSDQWPSDVSSKADLIAQIQQPPFAKIGVLDLDSFYPQKDRFELALALNNLLAAPGFQLWMQGVPLDVGQLLRSSAGKPRVAIFSIAHLSDA